MARLPCEIGGILLDAFIEEKAAIAQAEIKVVRYTGAITLVDGKAKAAVGLVNVAHDDVLASLKPGDNIFVINSQRYTDNALVIQGPGAGKEVTKLREFIQTFTG